MKKQFRGYYGYMLSYLHAFHAGNAADVLKHSVLVFCLDYLKKKEKPLLCVDTHAGAGFYDFSESAGARNREWRKGIGRLCGEEVRGALPPMIAAYLKIAGMDMTGRAGSVNLRYPGSPVIMARLLERGDRLVCFELHPREAESLRASMTELRSGTGPSVEVRREDGPGGLKALLPPPSRRGLVLIDPPWEEQSEYESVPRALREGLARFPEGTFIVWYPLLEQPKEKTAIPLAETLFALTGGKRCLLELRTEAAESARSSQSPRGMYGSALVIHNPPWSLRAALEETLPRLAKTLGGKDGSWRLEWEG